VDPIDGWPGADDYDADGGSGDGDFTDYDLVANDSGPGDPLGDGFDPADDDFSGTGDSSPTDDYPTDDYATDDYAGADQSDDYSAGDYGPGADESVGPAVTAEESIGPAVDAADDPSMGPTDESAVDPADDDGSREVIGADPDQPVDEPGWTDLFPPVLELPDVPEPTDGWPWTDAGFLGADLGAGDRLAGVPTLPDLRVDVADLLAYAAEDGTGGEPWAALAGSDDPAVAALARFWGPPGGPVG
jgi:hypothetical protein